MSSHSFDTGVADEVGVNAAILLANIQFWTEKNRANDTHFYDGKYWCYNSVKAFSTIFFYLTPKQIRTALDRLEEAGYVETGNFNENRFDHRKWFCPSGQIGLTSGADQNCPVGQNRIAPEGKSYKDNITSYNPDIAFTDFWAAYPQCKRKTDKPKAKIAFEQIISGKAKSKGIPKTNPEKIVDGVRKYAATKPDLEFVPLPTTWLNGARWETVFTASDGPDSSKASRYKAIAEGRA